MGTIRSLLWIGRGEDFAGELAADAPTLDVVWERDAAGAADLSLDAFDALLVDAAGVDEALETLRCLARKPGFPPILVRLASEHGARAPECVSAGAAEVVLRRPPAPGATRPGEGLLAQIERVAGRAPSRVRRPDSAPEHLPGIIGGSARMRAVYALVRRASASHATVLVSGETGTGKELVARAVHAGGRRSRAPFVAVNCAAFPDTLLESELFGHVRGAFTGADRDRKGLFEEAQGGTLFLDEVSETSGRFQAKLLRVLQEREVRPVGGARPRRIDVRLVAATNGDLWRRVGEGRFREDVYYRLAVFPIALPPLRERRGDILPLAEHFLALHGAREDKPDLRIGPEAAVLLASYAWPGNVRELENEVQRALALADPGDQLATSHFSQRLRGLLEPIQTLESLVEPGEALRESLGRIEAWLIRRALDAHGGRRAATARRLAITREGLYKKMKRYGIA